MQGVQEIFRILITNAALRLKSYRAYMDTSWTISQSFTLLQQLLWSSVVLRATHRIFQESTHQLYEEGNVIILIFKIKEM